MLGQIWGLFVLKWQLLKHTWSRGKLLSLIAGILVFLGALVLAATASAGTFYLGRTVINPEEPAASLGLLSGLLLFFLFFWLWALLFEIQRSDVIDLRKMLFLPVSLPMIFGLNFFLSLFSPALLFFLPCALALIAGLTLRYGGHMLWAIPLAAVFFLMLGAWAYYIRGLLTIFMENKRRRRLILTMVPLVFVMLAQLPNLFFRTGFAGNGEDAAEWLQHEQLVEWLFLANAVVPAGWLPLGVWALLQGTPHYALRGFVGMALLACAGLALGYRSTVRHYTGGQKTRPKKEKVYRRRATLTGLRLPGLAEDTCALTLAAFLSYLRHPQIRMLIIMPLCLGLFFLFLYGSDFGGGETHGAWLPVMVLVWPFFNFAFILLNVFGIDRESFRGLVLLPTPRHKYLLAKNLALFPFVGGLSLLFVLLGALLLRPGTSMLLISLVQVFQLYLAFSLAGNFASIYFPYRIQHDTMRRQNNRPLMMLIGIGSALFVMLMMVPAVIFLLLDELLEVYWDVPAAVPVGLLASLALLLLTVFAYVWSLRHAGDLLMAREQQVLATLVRDRE